MNESGSTLAIIGGGLAGMAAAIDAVGRGLRVELFERAKTLGGRAGSFVDGETGDRIDYCQHVAMGCCTEFLDFCRRTGIDDCFERTDTLHLIGPESDRNDLAPTRWLPVPLHLLPGLMRLAYLSWGERWRIVRAMRKLVRENDTTMENSRRLTASGGSDDESTETIGAWLRRQGQSPRAIERFWSVVLVGALGETVDRASLSAARKVFCDGFLASRGAGDLVPPRVPLGEIFHDRLSPWLTDKGVKIHLETPVRRVEGDQRRARTVVLADGTRKAFDRVVVAVPWRGARTLFDEHLSAAMPALEKIKQIEPAAIIAVHLWFDRPVVPLPHAVLVGRLSQWAFAKPRGNGGQYCQIVISASHRLAERTHDALLAEVDCELGVVWPKVRKARQLHRRVVVQPAAVFSIQPGLDRLRPPQQTPIENLALAGDWTSTGWPATMESAVRSGRQAVRALLGPAARGCQQTMP